MFSIMVNHATYHGQPCYLPWSTMVSTTFKLCDQATADESLKHNLEVNSSGKNYLHLQRVKLSSFAESIFFNSLHFIPMLSNYTDADPS